MQPSSAVPSAHLLSTVSVNIDSFEGFNERRSLHYLHTHASEKISTYFEGEFWCYSLHASQSEPSIHHALVAVSSFYEAHELSLIPTIPTSADRCQYLTTFALHQYTKAISLLSKSTGSSLPTPQVVLISCLIFIWLELLQDNVDTALGHLRSGLLILSHQLQISGSGDFDGSLVRLFVRLHTQATLHGSATSDFDPTEIVIISEEPSAGRLRITDIRGARSSLDEQLNKVFRFHRTIERPGFVERCLRDHPYPDELSLETMCQAHLDGLRAWETAFHDMEQSLNEALSQKDKLCLAELELQYLITTNTLATLFATTPMVYDSYNTQFARMVHLSRRLVQSKLQKRLLALPFDTGVLAPLFYVLLKCRDLRIRREAIELLHECPEREGMWDRAAILELTEWKIAKEEQWREFLGVSELDPMPEQARIYCEKPQSRVVQGRSVTVVTYKRGAYGGIADIEPDEEEVTNLSARLAAVLGT